MKLPYFGKLNLNALEEYYDAETELDDQMVQLDLNFENKSIKESKLTKIADTLKDLKGLFTKCTAFIQEDFKNGDDVKEYLTYHLEEFSEKEIASLLAGANTSLSKEEQLLSVLKLHRIGFYPDSDREFIVADFGTNREISDYILVINVNKDGGLDYISIES